MSDYHSLEVPFIFDRPVGVGSGASAAAGANIIPRYVCALGDAGLEKYFVLEKKLGAGHFGSVHSAVPTEHGVALIEAKGKRAPAKVAIKTIEKIENTFVAASEIYFLSALDLKGTIEYYGCIEIPGKGLHIVMEYFEGYDLLEIVNAGVFRSVNDKNAVVKQFAIAIKEIHDAGVVHRDIKPENVMVNPATLKLKLIDFGLSCDQKNNYGVCHGKSGTLAYFDLAPDTNLVASDWWSFGQVLVAIYAMVGLYAKGDYRKMTDEELLQIPDAIKPMLIRLSDPDIKVVDRPTEPEILTAVMAL